MWKFLQQHMTWRAVPIAAFAAGTLFLLVNLLTVPLMDIAPGLLLRYMASLVMGSDVLIDPPALTIPVGLVVHYALSLVFTLIIAIVVHRWGLLIGIVGGGLLGLAFYGLNFYLFTLFFEWFFAMTSEILLASHIVFGMIAGGIYELFDHYDIPFDLNRETSVQQPGEVTS